MTEYFISSRSYDDLCMCVYVTRCNLQYVIYNMNIHIPWPLGPSDVKWTSCVWIPNRKSTPETKKTYFSIFPVEWCILCWICMTVKCRTFHNLNCCWCVRWGTWKFLCECNRFQSLVLYTWWHRRIFIAFQCFQLCYPHSTIGT